MVCGHGSITGSGAGARKTPGCGEIANVRQMRGTNRLRHHIATHPGAISWPTCGHIVAITGPPGEVGGVDYFAIIRDSLYRYTDVLTYRYTGVQCTYAPV